MTNMLKDKNGTEMDREEVKDLAWININGSLTKDVLVTNYVDHLDNDELLEWATDANGEFSDG